GPAGSNAGASHVVPRRQEGTCPSSAVRRSALEARRYTLPRMTTGTARHAARCVRITRPGGPEVLALGTRQLRPPQRGELLVDVAASGLNRADVLQRQGHYPAPPDAPPDVPGLEWAGTIAELGADALGPLGHRWRAGDRV